MKEVNLKVSADTAGSELFPDKPSLRLKDLKIEPSCRNYVNRIKSQIVKIGISKEDPDSILKLKCLDKGAKGYELSVPLGLILLRIITLY